MSESENPIANDMPTTLLSNLRFPSLLARHETGRVTATILNPRDKTIGYFVHIDRTIIEDGGRHTSPVVFSEWIILLGGAK
jgi:hypothetical protein